MTATRMDSDNLLDYALSVSNDDRTMAYAFAFGFVWAILDDKQKECIQRHIDSKENN